MNTNQKTILIFASMASVFLMLWQSIRLNEKFDQAGKEADKVIEEKQDDDKEEEEEEEEEKTDPTAPVDRLSQN